MILSFVYFLHLISLISYHSENIQVLLWGKEESELDRLNSRLTQLYYDNLLSVRAHFYSSCLSYYVCLLDAKLNMFTISFIQVTEPMEGLQEWLDAVSSARIPCAVVSGLDRRKMVEALERMGLLKYFQVGIFKQSNYFIDGDNNCYLLTH